MSSSYTDASSEASWKGCGRRRASPSARWEVQERQRLAPASNGPRHRPARRARRRSRCCYSATTCVSNRHLGADRGGHVLHAFVLARDAGAADHVAIRVDRHRGRHRSDRAVDAQSPGGGSRSSCARDVAHGRRSSGQVRGCRSTLPRPQRHHRPSRPAERAHAEDGRRRDPAPPSSNVTLRSGAKVVPVGAKVGRSRVPPPSRARTPRRRGDRAGPAHRQAHCRRRRDREARAEQRVLDVAAFRVFAAVGHRHARADGPRVEGVDTAALRLPSVIVESAGWPSAVV